jgi:hypothetical protein
MTRLLALIQFLPLTVFVGVAQANGSDGKAWALAFQWGAAASIIELLILFPLLKNRLSRLVAGMSAFLIFGGAAFYFKSEPLLNILGLMRASAMIFFVGLVCVIATFATKTGVFEKEFSSSGGEKKYSYYFLAAVAVAFAWSYSFRDQPLLGGAPPFIFLILLKQYFEKKMIR